jgi:hypothetical protein
MSDNYETLVVRVPVPLVDHFRQFLDSLDGARELSAWPLDECCLEIEDDDSRIQIGQLDLQVDAADSLSVVSLALFAYQHERREAQRLHHDWRGIPRRPERDHSHR